MNFLPIFFFLFTVQLTDQPYNYTHRISILRNDTLNTNVIEKYAPYKFNNIWLETPNSAVYGIIGDSFKRIRIKFINIIRDTSDQRIYNVYGKSKVDNTICEFQGTISLTEIIEYEYNPKIDSTRFQYDEFYNSDILSRGHLEADYEFFENKDQRNSGVFKGKLYSFWYLSRENDRIYYGPTEPSDGYTNNNFIGTWQSYKSGVKKICNWGDFRVPMTTMEFDSGAGEFHPVEKYHELGWKTVIQAHHEENKTAIEIENAKWWE